MTPNNRFKRAYVRRIVDDDLDKLMPALPAIHLDGPKAVGKTATASQRAKTLHRHSDPQLRVLAESDPGRLTAGSNSVLIDEWQLAPATWDAV